MNTALKHWKEAATVILVAGTRHRPAALDGLKRSDVHPTVNCDPSVVPHKAFDYEVLLLKRSGKSGFMPNAYVFPGGLVDSSDFSSEWLEIFRSFRHSPHFGVGVVKQPPETRPPMFATDRVKLGSPIPGDVAFRICAVRETFEESGILLVVPNKNEQNTVNSSNHVEVKESFQTKLASMTERWDKRELAKWRILVNKNPFNFIRMCKELECIPNIWALHEWGNWLTPTGVYGKERRYDTAFYMCCLQETPHTVQDDKEIVHFKWSTPSEVLQRYQAREIWVAPPQFYDLGRMCRFPQLQGLHSFARSRAQEGCEQWLPVRLVAADCYLTLLPGDGLYPESAERSESSARTERTLEELQQDGTPQHRIVFYDLYTAAVHVSVAPKYKHLVPVPVPASPYTVVRSSQL